MPSWSARLHLGSPVPGPGPKSRARKSPPHGEDRIEDNTYHGQLLHGVPVIALAGTSAPSCPSHGRSYSNPFPSTLDSGKKEERLFVRNGDTLETLARVSTGLASKNHMATNGTAMRNGERDLVTGKCITCDSLVRWPRHLDLFRCTVCLMVNDLKRGAGLSREDREAESPRTAMPSSNPEVPRKGTMSPVATVIN